MDLDLSTGDESLLLMCLLWLSEAIRLKNSFEFENDNEENMFGLVVVVVVVE